MKNSPTCSTRRRALSVAGAALLCLAALVLSLCLGAAGIPLPRLWEALVHGGEGIEARVLWYARAPRAAACLLAGAALSVSGAVIQSVLANPLAAPNIIGVNAGAGLAVSVCCAVGASGWAAAGAAFFGALGAVMLVVALAQRTGASRSTVALGGVAVGSFLSAVTEAVAVLSPEAGVGTADFRVGGFSAVSPARLAPAGALILLALAAAFSQCSELDVLSLGEETAHGLGLGVRRMRLAFLTIAALLAGASVSFAGSLGFVGLVVPHIARRFTGGESRWLLPMCALSGGALVTLCDLAARLLFAPYELPAGVLLSAVGAPFFVLLLLRRRRGRIHD